MADFKTAYDLMIAHEGGYVNDQDDPGGETNAGISDMFDGKKDGMIDIDSDHIPDAKIKDLTEAQKLEFYKLNFWDKINGDLIASQKMANSIFDFGVNAGIVTSSKLAQMVVGFSNPDGEIGKNTLAKLNIFDPDHFVAAFTVAKITRYVNIVKKRDTSKKYFFGWVCRALNL